MHGAVIAAPYVQCHRAATDLPGIGHGVVVQRLPHVLAPAGFVHAQVVNVQCAVVQKHRVVFPHLQNAEAVAQHLPVLDGHENGTGVIGEHPGEGLLVIFLRACPEQVGTDAVVDFPHLKQQVNHTGNIPGFSKPDFHNNFRPEPQYENGCESLWAMQYSMNDGTNNGNCNWSYGLIVPNIPGVTDGGCDFYKPSQNLVNAFRTDKDGHPLFDTFNNNDYNVTSDNADPRLFLTVGMPGFPYEFNTKYMMDKSSTWSRSNGLYGYYVTLKQNVDPDSGYLIKGGWWGSPMNHIVLRYADVLLMRAEALIQLNDGRIGEAIDLINELRNRASQSTTMIANYPSTYGVTFYVKPYTGTYTKDEALKMLKFERRVELAMECDRFFDLVRWGEADQVLNKFYAEEADNCAVYSSASFTKNKNEYLPIPFAQISASNGHYTQNCGGW